MEAEIKINERFDSLDKDIQNRILFFVKKKYEYKKKSIMGRPLNRLTKEFYFYLLKYYESPTIGKYTLEEFSKDVKIPKTTLMTVIKREELTLLQFLKNNC